MQIASLNKNTEKYGYPEIMEYNNPRFHGHQVGIAICARDAATGIVEENYLSEKLGDINTREFLLGELLHEGKAVFATKDIVQVNSKGEFVPKTVYYLPYFVVDHSRFKPTIIHTNIKPNIFYNLKVEVLLVNENDYSRYITISFEKVRNKSAVELVCDFFDYSYDEYLEEKAGIKWYNKIDDKDDEGYILDFYDNTGDTDMFVVPDSEDFKDMITSIRLIDIEEYID